MDGDADRDGQSDRAAKSYADFFRQHPEHPQSARFQREWEELCAESGKPLNWQPNEEQPQLLPDGEEQPDEDEIGSDFQQRLRKDAITWKLADNAYLHGFSRMTLLRCYVPRYNEPGRLMLWRDFLLAVERGEFDYMLMDASEQPYS